MGPAAMILAKAKPMDSEDDGEDLGGGKDAAASAILDAFEQKDSGALARALTDFFDMCSYGPEAE